MCSRDLARDERSHRVADQMRFLDFEVVEETHDIRRHFEAVLVRLMRLVALAMSTAVQSDDLEAGCRGELGVSGAILPPHAGISHPAVNQNDGFPFSRN